MSPSQKEKEARAQRRERGSGEARSPLKHPAALQTLVEAQPPSGRGRSLAQPSQGSSVLQDHLSCPPSSTAAAPHSTFLASSTTKAAHCCSVLCQPDMSSSKTHMGVQRRPGMIIALWDLGEAPLQGPLPSAAPSVTVDTPLPVKPLVQPVKNVT